MAPVALVVELKTLAWSVILLLAQIGLQSIFATAEHGPKYNASPRDERLVANSPLAGRAQRALANLLETYPAFVGLALALAATGRSDGWGAWGALIWFWARVAYVPAYLMGVPFLRTAIWIVSVLGLVAMLTRLLA